MGSFPDTLNDVVLEAVIFFDCRNEKKEEGGFLLSRWRHMKPRRWDKRTQLTLETSAFQQFAIFRLRGPGCCSQFFAAKLFGWDVRSVYPFLMTSAHRCFFLLFTVCWRNDRHMLKPYICAVAGGSSWRDACEQTHEAVAAGTKNCCSTYAGMN